MTLEGISKVCFLRKKCNYELATFFCQTVSCVCETINNTPYSCILPTSLSQLFPLSNCRLYHKTGTNKSPLKNLSFYFLYKAPCMHTDGTMQVVVSVVIWKKLVAVIRKEKHYIC